MSDKIDGRVVLVVDDEAFARLLAVQVFLDEGYTVLEACDAAEALDVLDGNDDVSLLFTDIHMPGSLDGVALIEIVRQCRPQVAIVATSGHGQLVADRIPDATFLAKPYPVNALSTTIRQVQALRATT